MKWCPTCKIEFEDYVDKCSECSEMLISEAEYHQQKKHRHCEYSPDALNLLVVYESTLESDVLHVSDLLEEHGIYSEIKNDGIGSYLQIYSGVNYLGTSICVKEEEAETAKMIIESLWGKSTTEIQLEEANNSTFEEVETDMDVYRQRYNKSLRLKRNFLKAFLLLLLGTSLAVTLMPFFN
ncbi:putative signal transducing protein [Fusibacter bizertensis]